MGGKYDFSITYTVHVRQQVVFSLIFNHNILYNMGGNGGKPPHIHGQTGRGPRGEDEKCRNSLHTRTETSSEAWSGG